MKVKAISLLSAAVIISIALSVVTTYERAIHANQIIASSSQQLMSNWWFEKTASV